MLSGIGCAVLSKIWINFLLIKFFEHWKSSELLLAQHFADLICVNRLFIRCSRITWENFFHSAKCRLCALKLLQCITSNWSSTSPEIANAQPAKIPPTVNRCSGLRNRFILDNIGYNTVSNNGMRAKISNGFTTCKQLRCYKESLLSLAAEFCTAMFTYLHLIRFNCETKNVTNHIVCLDCPSWSLLIVQSNGIYSE